jgi:hypothetical protein
MPPARDLNDVSGFLVTGRAGDVIFREGDAGSDLFVVQDGRIELSTAAGGSRPVGVCQAGDFFGEQSLFGDARRPLTARATTEYVLLCLDRETFDRVSQEDPAILRIMLARLAGRMPAGAAEPVAARPAAPPAPVGPIVSAVIVVAASRREIALPARDEVSVGRLDAVTRYTPDVDLSAADPERSVGRRHARILRRGGRLFVSEVADTRNGTFVNGQRIDKGTEVELANGDRIRFGLVETVLRLTR